MNRLVFGTMMRHVRPAGSALVANSWNRFTLPACARIPSAGRALSTGREEEQRASLADVLQTELKYEMENLEDDKQAVSSMEKLPKKLQSLLEGTGFQLENVTLGSKEIQLVKTVNEGTRMTVSFDVVSVCTSGTDAEALDDDDELVDENVSSQRVDEDSSEQEDEALGEESFSMVVDVTKTENGKDAGTLTFHVSYDGVQDYWIEEVEFSTETRVAKSLTAEDDFQRSTRYLSPRFANLDEELQDAFHAYLEEQGFSVKVCDFVDEYSEWREQREYIKWLQDVKSFVKH